MLFSLSSSWSLGKFLLDVLVNDPREFDLFELIYQLGVWRVDPRAAGMSMRAGVFVTFAFIVDLRCLSYVGKLREYLLVIVTLETAPSWRLGIISSSLYCELVSKLRDALLFCSVLFIMCISFARSLGVLTSMYDRKSSSRPNFYE